MRITSFELNLGKVALFIVAVLLGWLGLVSWWVVLLVLLSTVDLTIKHSF